MDAADLIAWLTAQLDQDERAALSRPRISYADQPPPWGRSFPRPAFRQDQELATIAVKRALLTDAVESLSERALALLAQPYAGREGWKDDWAI